MIDENDFEGAILKYQQLLEIDPKNKEVKKNLEFKLAKTFYDSKLNYSAVVQHTSNALEIESNFFDALVLRARAYCAMKEFVHSLTDCFALSRLKISIDQQIFIDDLRKEITKAQEVNQRPTSYVFATADIESKEYFKEVIAKPIDQKPRELHKVKKAQKAEDISNLGCQELAQKHYKKAIDLYSQAINLQPQGAFFLINRSTCFLEMKEFQKAIADALKAIEVDSIYWKSYSQIVNCFLALGDINQAELFIKKFDSDVPGAESIEMKEKLTLESLKSFHAKIKQSYSDKNFAECLKNIESALKIAYSCANYNEIKIECLIMVGKYKDADELINSKLQHMPNDPNSIFLKGLNWYHQSDLTSSIMRFEEALRVDPDFKRAQELRKAAKEMIKLKESGELLICLI